MPPGRLEFIVFCVYLLFGPQGWAFYGTMMFAGRRKMLLLKRPHDPFAEPPPSVTILIPAKDEGERIRACVLSALNQDYPSVDVITIDDRSGDNTGAVMDELAAGHPRLKVLHNQEPPAQGWTGKNNALHQGMKLATGEWLLFVDSDVVLEPDALSASMAVALRKKFDLVSLLPRLESHTLWESLLVPLAAGAASSMYLIPLANNHLWKNTAFANGQFMLMSRAAYDAIGGHVTVRDRFCEDVEIARLMKVRGFKPRIAWGNDFSAVRMYNSVADIFKGWSRIYYSAPVGSPLTVLAGIAFLTLCCFSGYAALLWGLYRLAYPLAAQAGGGVVQSFFAAHAGGLWVGAALVHLALLTYFVGVLYHWSGNPRRNALLFPVGGSMLMAIFFKALKMCVTKKVEWRGTNYAHVMAPTIGDPPPAKAG